MKTPTLSIRKGSLKPGEEIWIGKDGQWGSYENRKRFSDNKGTAQDDIEQFMESNFPGFNNYGTFPNS